MNVVFVNFISRYGGVRGNDKAHHARQPNENYSLNFENIENRYMTEHANTYTKTVVEESDDLL